MLTVVNKNGTFSGVQYDAIEQDIIDHHHKYGQKLVWIDRKVKIDDRGNPLETPTEDDLKNEITKKEAFLKERVQTSEDAIMSLMDMNLMGGI